MDMMMSQKEAKRRKAMELLTAGKIDQKEAGKMLAVSVRQIKRILRRYRTLVVSLCITITLVGVRLSSCSASIW
jgi:hypothetical protein